MVRIRCKWNKQFLEADVDPATITATELKEKLCGLSGVPIERMKVMGKGLWKGVLKDDAVINGAAWKEGSLLSMMGTSTGVKILEKPKEEIKFVEDLTAKEQALAGKVAPPGLHNLGNTCYLNSAVQCLKAVPDLREALTSFVPSGSMDIGMGVTTALKRLYEEMDQSLEPVTPIGFVSAVRSAFPEFAQISQRGGGYEQQDSDEFLLRLMTVLKQQIKHVPASIAGDKMIGGDTSVVDSLFGIEFSQELSCDECDAEPVKKKTGGELRDTKLTCNVEADLTHVSQGLLHHLNGQVEIHSDILGRTALWTQKTRRDHAGVNCKKLKAMSYSSTIDVFDLCDENLKRILKVQRDALGDAILSGSDSAAPKSAGTGDVQMGDAGAAGADEGEDDDELKKALAMSMEVEAQEADRCGIGLPPKFRGLYDLFGVVTHKGRAANSGHYMGWTKQGGDDWICFDDDGASECKEDYVLANLKGGGDAHMAYIVFYKAKTEE